MKTIQPNGVIAILERAAEYLKTNSSRGGPRSQALLAVNVAAEAKNQELHRAFPGAAAKAINYVSGVTTECTSAEEYISEALEAASALEKPNG